MHNRALHDTLASLVVEAAYRLSEEVASGAEVPYELLEQGNGSAPLYCYRSRSDRFIAERAHAIEALPSFPAAVQGMRDLPNLEGYLRAQGAPARGRGVIDNPVMTFLCAIWVDAAEFVFDETRFEQAYATLEQIAYHGCAHSVVLAPVEGLVLESERVTLASDLALVHASELDDAPEDLGSDPLATVAVLELRAESGREPSLAGAGRRLRRLQTALRLWDGTEPAVGPVAWARTDGGPWIMVSLPGGVRRSNEDYLLGVEEEGSLSGFCSLVARRSPHSGELAWAMRRFELGCERATTLEALTDWLLAARALLGESGAGDDLVCERLAAICATADEWEAMTARLREAVALERRAMHGVVRGDHGGDEVVAEVGEHVRAVLRDVICGHLDPDLRRVAENLLVDEEQTATA